MEKALKIGDVARQAGVGVDTVRYYERRGVLPQASRRPSGYREFTTATAERIRFAKGLQQLGFTLDDVVAMLQAIDAGTATCVSEQPRVEHVLQQVDEKLATLRKVRGRLARTLRRCREGSCTMLDEVSRWEAKG